MRRLLVIRLDNIGDVVLLSPSLRALRQALPQASITLMASPAGSQVAPLLPWVDDVIVHRAVWQDVSRNLPQRPEQEMALIEMLRQRNFDAAVIFTSFSQSPYPPAYVCYLAGIPLRLGQSPAFGGGILSDWIRPSRDEMHQAERNLFLLESVGFPIHDRHLALQLPDGAQETADRLLHQRGINPEAPYIVIAPGASCPARRYPAHQFAAAMRHLAAQTTLPLVVVGTEREQEKFQPILSQAWGGQMVSLVGATTLPQLAAVIRRAHVVLANNSGPLHIADTFARPMVILYSGTEYESQWRPRRAPARLLRRPTSCSPCYAFHCPYQLECLDIPPQEVAEAVCSLLHAPARAQIDTFFGISDVAEFCVKRET
ncbi:MAG: glycosyltransferase family 9 protein [Anaerolineaceae bacterium]|nr:glycosyltransferase family 9 protein [Anaerolineaceae bacterium]